MFFFFWQIFYLFFGKTFLGAKVVFNWQNLFINFSAKLFIIWRKLHLENFIKQTSFGEFHMAKANDKKKVIVVRNPVHYQEQDKGLGFFF